MHRIEIIGPSVASQGVLMLGVSWLKGLVKSETGQLTIMAERVKTPANRSESWTVTCGTHAQEFDVGGEWPNPQRLIDHGDYEIGCAFRPDFLGDMVRCAEAWWNHKEEEIFPLVIKQMSPQKVSTFTIKNEVGRLRMDIMPVIFDEDDE
jgi:hypothetical protein